MKPELERYCELLANSPGGMLGPAERERAADHVDDSLVGVPALQVHAPTSIIDVGSGAGLPGIPLFLSFPDCSGHLVESEKRKATFLEACLSDLGLTDRCTVLPDRAEDVGRGSLRESFDAATCRALAAPIVSAEYLAPLVKPGGTVLIWTSNQLANSTDWSPAGELGLSTPTIHSTPSKLRDDGVIVELTKTTPTSDRFPRRIGVAKKRPLS